jgi:8-oxo-dGTP pyrophosphatase MutT (NUDIX family)
LEQTARREALEEVQLLPDCYDIIGPLSQLYIPPTNNLVQPYLAWSPAPPAELYPDPHEVENVISLPLTLLLEADRLQFREMTLNIGTHQVPYWDVPPVPLWGATAMIISELIVLWEEFSGETTPVFKQLQEGY